MEWNALTAVASVISMIAFVATALYVRGELKHLEKERYLNVTNQLFAIWESPEFMQAQLWLLHRLEETTWEDFIRVHRADYGEQAFHRVGSFYDRLGTLVRRGYVDTEEVLSTLGGYGIAIWNKIEPLVLEARRIENSNLFDDFEKILPDCRACYVPALGEGGRVNPFSLAQPADSITAAELRDRLARGEAITVLDVRREATGAGAGMPVPGAIRLPPEEIEARAAELPKDREVVVYCG